MKTLFSFVLFTLLFAACTPDRDEPCREHKRYNTPLDVGLSTLLPYQRLFDSTPYLYNDKDTVYFRIVDIDTFYNDTKLVQINPECRPDIEVFEQRNFHCMMRSGFSVLYRIHSIDRVLYIASYHPPLFDEKFTEQDILSGKPFADSMEVQGKIYTRVFRTADYKDTLYFNREFGFVKMINRNAYSEIETYELIRN